MYRAILPDGEITCSRFGRDDRGVELYAADDTMIAFVPYDNLVALVNQEADQPDERSYM